MDRKLFVAGLVGTTLTALGCVLALFIVLSDQFAKPHLSGWIDFLLLPALALFGGLLAISLLFQRKS